MDDEKRTPPSPRPARTWRRRHDAKEDLRWLLKPFRHLARDEFDLADIQDGYRLLQIRMDQAPKSEQEWVELVAAAGFTIGQPLEALFADGSDSG
jgi:hypothetical protein